MFFSELCNRGDLESLEYFYSNMMERTKQADSIVEVITHIFLLLCIFTGTFNSRLRVPVRA